MKYTSHITETATPQSVPVFGKDQVENSAGGFVFKTSDQTFLNRFLILGSEGGTYYASERKLTQDTAKTIVGMIKRDGEAVVDFTRQVSVDGRAPKNDPAIFVLALCAAYGDAKTKKAAYDSIHNVCRIGTHIFQFCEAVNDLRGWSKGLCRGVGEFYTAKTPDQVALQLIKYRQRGGWTHKDVMRLAHPSSVPLNDLFRWAVGKEVGTKHPLIEAFERVQATTDPKEAIQIIKENRLPWEAVPTELLGKAEVWSALLESIPLGALVRNLGRLSSLGLTEPLSDATARITTLLSNDEAIVKAHLHPLSILVALRIYQQGHGEKGSLTWDANTRISEALDEAYYKSFKAVEPMGKRVLQAIDVSGSMDWSKIAGLPITPRVAAAAMAMLRVRVEPQVLTTAFSTRLQEAPLTKAMSLSAVETLLSRIQMGGTDCSLPMVYATERKIPVDVFEIYTDNETWAGRVHPFQALKTYRRVMGIDAKMVVYGMTATSFSIADPSDPGMMDVVGFDTATPAVVSAWAK